MPPEHWHTLRMLGPGVSPPGLVLPHWCTALPSLKGGQNDQAYQSSDRIADRIFEGKNKGIIDHEFTICEKPDACDPVQEQRAYEPEILGVLIEKCDVVTIHI